MDIPDIPDIPTLRFGPWIPNPPYDRCDICTQVTHCNVDATDGQDLCFGCYLAKMPLANHFESEWSDIFSRHIWIPGFIHPDDSQVLVQPVPVPKEYWYFLTWTLGTGKDVTIQRVRKNIESFVARRNYKGLQMFYADCVLEGDGETKRHHYHMRIKTRVAVKMATLCQKYQKCGKVHSKPMIPRTLTNWLLPSGDGGKPYLEKEGNPIHILLDE